MTAPLRLARDLSQEYLENTPLVPNNDLKKIQKLVLLSFWGLTAGMCLSTAFSTRSYLPAAIAPSLLPFNWLAFPFKPIKPVNEHLDAKIQKIEKIYQFVFISLFSLFGLATPYILLNYIKPIADLSEKDLAKDTSLIIGQCALIAFNLAASKKLHSQENPETRLSFLKFLKSTQSSASSFFARAKGIFSSNDPVEPSNAPQINIETIRLAREANLRSAKIDHQLREFIKSDSELDQAFNYHFNQTHGILIPLPKLNEAPDVGDLLLNEFGAELMMADYWLQMTESFRDFLYKNPEFARLLASKFNASDLENKKEILKFYGFS